MFLLAKVKHLKVAFVILGFFLLSNSHAGYVDELASKCDRGNSGACMELAEKYEKGSWWRGIKKSEETARKYYDKACRFNSTYACSRLGDDYYFAQAYSTAKRYFEKSCRLGGWGCYRLGCMYEEGLGVRRSYSTARRYYAKACDDGDGEACQALGLMYSDGLGVRKSEDRADDYFERACELGIDESCVP